MVNKNKADQSVNVRRQFALYRLVKYIGFYLYIKYIQIDCYSYYLKKKLVGFYCAKTLNQELYATIKIKFALSKNLL